MKRTRPGSLAALLMTFVTIQTYATCLAPTHISASLSQNLSTTRAEVSASGYAEVKNLAGDICGFMPVTAALTINTNGSPAYSESQNAYGTASAMAFGGASPGNCYSSTITGSSAWLPDETKSTGQDCWYGPPPPPGDPADQCDGLGGFGNPCSPIVINLADAEWRLSGADDPVSFDIDADGRPNRITWTGRGEPLAFLARDRNANGVIDDGRELFGTATLLTSGSRAVNGFEALAELDENDDGVIDGLDAVWTKLLLWTDCCGPTAIMTDARRRASSMRSRRATSLRCRRGITRCREPIRTETSSATRDFCA